MLIMVVMTMLFLVMFFVVILMMAIMVAGSVNHAARRIVRPGISYFVCLELAVRRITVIIGKANRAAAVQVIITVGSREMPCAYPPAASIVNELGCGPVVIYLYVGKIVKSGIGYGCRDPRRCRRIDVDAYRNLRVSGRDGQEYSEGKEFEGFHDVPF